MKLYRTPKTMKGPDGKKVPVLDGKGRKVYHPAWRFEYLDRSGRRRFATGTSDRKETERLAQEVQARERMIRRGLLPAARSSQKAAARPLAEIMSEYLSEGEKHGGRGGRPWGPDHARKRRERLSWWLGRFGEGATLQDLASGAGLVLAGLDELHERGLAGKTVENYKDAISALCDWSVKRNLMDADPLKNIGSWDCTPRTTRRALTPGEVRELIIKARPENRLLYELAIFSGLRARELGSLKVRDLDLEQGGLALSASWTKARKPGFQPLPKPLVRRLVDHVQDLAPEAPLVKVPVNPAAVLYRDLALAGIPKAGPGGKVDFHSLRTTFVNLVLATGADIKTSMDLSRLSTPNLVLNTYGRSRWERRSEVVQGLAGNLDLDPELAAISPVPKVACMASGEDYNGFSEKTGGSNPPFRTKLTAKTPSDRLRSRIHTETKLDKS